MVTEIKRMRQRRDTSANWTLNNPVLLDGEMGYDTTIERYKIGDGTSAWSALPYADQGPQGVPGPSGGPFPDLDGVDAGFVAETTGDGGVQFVRSAPLARAGQEPSEAPLPDSSASVGTLPVAARADHVHPSSGFEGSPFGTGQDGDLVFDGTTPVVLPKITAVGEQGEAITLTPVSGVYTAVSPIMASSITGSAGVRLQLAQGAPLMVTGAITGPEGGTPFVISTDGPAGLANGTAPGSLAGAQAPATGNGGAGGTTTGGNGTGAGGIQDQGASARGGAGGAGASGAGGVQSSADVSSLIAYFQRDPGVRLNGRWAIYQMQGATYQAVLAGGNGGGGGGGDGTNKGGSGGAGGGVTLVRARKLVGNVLFRAKGGAGGAPAAGNTGGGGGGGGGFVLVNTLDDTDFTGSTSSALCCPGGAAGAGHGTGVAGSSGNTGISLFTVWG